MIENDQPYWPRRWICYWRKACSEGIACNWLQKATWQKLSLKEKNITVRLAGALAASCEIKSGCRIQIFYLQHVTFYGGFAAPPALTILRGLQMLLRCTMLPPTQSSRPRSGATGPETPASAITIGAPGRERQPSSFNCSLGNFS